MKQYIILIGATLVVLCLNCWQMSYLKKTAAVLKLQIEYIKAYVESDDYENAKKAYDTLEKNWNKVSNMWDVFTEHDDVEEFDSSMKSLNAYIVQEEKSDCVNEIAQLLQRIEHILKSESVSLATVF